MADTEDGFLSRWSRRKALAREGTPLPVEAQRAAPPAAEAAESPPAPPPPTLEEAQALTPASDFRRFVAPEVDASVRNTALKKLFADPHFNAMDGLDIYIDDYAKPDPLPAGMLRKMAQSQFLNLFADTPAPAPETDADEDPDLRLQPHDAAGPAGPEPGAEPDPGGER